MTHGCDGCDEDDGEGDKSEDVFGRATNSSDLKENKMGGMGNKGTRVFRNCEKLKWLF